MSRLAYVATAYIKKYDGISVYLENLLLKLLSDKSIKSGDIEVDVFVGSDVLTLLKSRLQAQLNDNIDKINFIDVKDKNPFIKTFDLTKKLYQHGSYDLVFMTNLMPILFAPGAKLKVIHDFSKRRHPELYTKFGLIYNLFLIHSAKLLDDAIGYISQSTKDDMKYFFDIDETNKKLLYVPNGIPFKVKQYQRPDEEFFKNKYSYNDLNLCVVGRINRHKGFDRLLDFCNYADRDKTFIDRFENITLHIVGKQTLETQKIFKNQNFQNIKLIFHGFLDDSSLNEIYKQSHFCFFLSRNEGYGLPLIEAMWFKSIPILSNIPIFREIMKENYPLFDDKSGYGKSIVSFIEKIYANSDYLLEIKNQIEEIIEHEKDGYQTAANNLINFINSYNSKK